jgi:hypothetical protein
MCTRHRLLKAAAAALVLAALPLLASPSLVADNRHEIAGTWLVWASPMPGVRVPLIQTLSPEGTIVTSDVTMFGGLPGVSIRATPMHGVWERTSRNVVSTTNLALIYDAPSSVLIGFSRSRATSSFDRHGDIAGTVIVEFLACPSPVACPDPLAADATWIPFPGFPPSFTFTGKRLSLVEAQQ